MGMALASSCHQSFGSVTFQPPEMMRDEIIAEKTTDDDDFVGRCGAGRFIFLDTAKSETAEALGPSTGLGPSPGPWSAVGTISSGG